MPEARRGRDERGYILLLTALVLVPLLVFASMAIDLGAWYARASKMQRAADAAALAGAAWMPDFTKAEAAARATATKNGFTTGGAITVAINEVPGNPYRLNVRITDADVIQFFSKLVIPNQTISREATADYLQPIPLGSPTNYFGTGNLFSGTPPAENVWAAVNGWCAARESGDAKLAFYDNAFGPSGYECDTSGGAFANPDYDPAGYLFAIRIPSPAPAGGVGIQVYSASFSPGVSGSPDAALKWGAKVTTTYRLLDAGNVYEPLSNPVLSTTTVASGDASYGGWMTMATIPSPCAGCTYYLQVYTQASEANSYGANSFGLRTTVGGSFNACTSEPGSSNPPTSSSCVRIHPHNELSVFANLTGATASFYLASIDPQYAGKRMMIDLFDVGEGANAVELLDPNGNPVSFNWSTPCSPPTPVSGGCSGTGVTVLYPNTTGAQPVPRSGSSSVYSNRTLTLSVTLPSNYTALYGTKSWWRIRYTTGSSPTDRTTWSVSIVGSPVHLVGA
jgi:hypothetical protein